MTFTLGIAAPAFPRTTRLILRQANDVSADFATLVQKSVLRHRVARQLALATLRRADAVICQSLAMQSDLRRLLGASAKLRVISNPIDVERITREAASLDVTLPGNPRLISVGRFMPQKGYDILLRAIAVARKRYPGLHLTILGDGPDRGALVQLARELELEQTVTFAGYSDHPVSSVRAADLFVLASRYEGFPNAALEALAVGTPVVLTDCPGASSEIVVPGLNGQLASAVDPESVARAIERAIHELPSCDRRRIVADCDARFGTRRIVSTYEDVIASVAD
jgi:glycosyltransferase involved in cell wall biosynthesis